MDEKQTTLKIGAFVLDVSSGTLSAAGKEDIRLTPKAADVLLYLAQHPGQLASREELHESVWSGRIVTDSQVSKAINELRTALDDLSDPRRYIETLPRRGYRLVCDVSFENNNLKPRPSLKPKGLKWSLAAIVLCLSASLLWFSNVLTKPVEVQPLRQTGVAVIPFRNLSPDPGNPYLGEGVAEEILIRLSRLDNLRVISRNSTFQLQSPDLDVRDIGRRLDVSHVLTGSIQKIDERLRVNVRLIETEEGTEVVAKQYNRQLTDLFSVQTEIAESVTRAIRPELLENDASALEDYGTTSVPAYEDYLTGRYLLGRRQRNEMAMATKAFEQALEKDPDYLLAHSGLVDSYSLRLLYGYISGADYQEGVAASANVLAQSTSHYAEILTSLGQVNKLNQNYEAAERYFRQALEVNKQYVQAYMWLAHLYTRYEPKQPQAAVNLLTTARRLDPISTALLVTLSTAQQTNGDFIDAKSTLFDLLAIEPNSFIGRQNLASYLRWVEGDLASAARLYHELWLDQNEYGLALALAEIFLELGEYELASAWFARTTEFVPLLGPFYDMQMLVAQGKNEEVIALAEAHIDTQAPEIIQVYANMLKGDYETALEYLAQIEAIMGTELISPIHVENAIFRCFLEKKLGEDHKANQTLQRLQGFLQKQRLLGEGHVGMKLARVYLLQDQEAEAVLLLQKAFALGVRNNLWMLDGAFFTGIEDHQEFRVLKQRIESERQRQRKNLEPFLPKFSSPAPAELSGT